VQIELIKPKLKPPGTKHLKRKCDKLLSNFAFNFNLRRYTMGLPVGRHIAATNANGAVHGRGLHSSTCQLNVSTFGVTRGIEGVFRHCLKREWRGCLGV
jgi:hypothetical protein